LEEDFPQSSFCSCGIRFGGFLVRYISSVATLTMTTGKCAKYTWYYAYFEYRRSKNLTVCSPGNSLLCGVPNTGRAKPDSLLPGKFPSLQSYEYRWSNSLRNILLQRALEFRRRSLILLRYPPEQPLLSSCGLVPPRRSKLLCGKSSSKRKSRAKVHPDGHHFEIIRV
jgi:hypothetical protein